MRRETEALKTLFGSIGPAVRAVVLTSTHPKVFCAGADLKERNSFTDAQLLAQRPVARAAYRSVLDLPVPAIAAVDGAALGGGFELALSCDLIIAGESALVGLPEVRVGVIPAGGGTQLLTRRVGWSKAASMIFTARRLAAAEGLALEARFVEKLPADTDPAFWDGADLVLLDTPRRLAAAEAHALGAVDEVVPDGTARERALLLAAEIAGNSPVGVRHAKRAMRLGFDVDLATGLEVEDSCWRATAFSPDRAEGVAAFNEKRPPRWPSSL